MSTFGPLHVSSHWSPGGSVVAPAELARRAAAAGLAALVLSDHETLSGQVEHLHACQAAGIRPVTGLALGRGARGRPRVVMLAEDAAGYRSLCRIVSRRRNRPAGDAEDAQAHDPVADVLAEPDGLLALSEDAETLRALLAGGFSGERSWVLLARPNADPAREARLVADAGALGVRVAAHPRLALATPEDLELLWLHRAIRNGCRRRPGAALDARLARARTLPFGAREGLFRDLPHAVAEAQRVLARCQAVDPAEGIAPLDAGPPGRDAAAVLARRARTALEDAAGDGGRSMAAYRDRLEHELALVGRMGLAGWFLAVDEIGARLRSRGIDAVARGSAGGSLLVHLLGLGSVDPVARGLVFERFLHESRSDPPDLDLDLPSDVRDEVVDWILSRWPRHAALVASHVRYRTRSAWREALTVLGAAPDAIATWCRRLPEGGAEADEGWVRRVAELVPEAARPMLAHVPRLVGVPRHLSTHPGAIVLTRQPVRDALPIATSPKGVPVTQFDATSLDALGVVRLDLLGSRGLQVLRRALAVAAADGRAPLRMDDIPPGDAATFALLDAGDTLGVFQVEAPATRQMLRRRRVVDSESLTEALAAVRPGPAAGHGPLFEEDVMRELSAAGGISLGEADLLRAAIVRAGEDASALARLGERFVQGAVERVGVQQRAEAAAAWARAERFAAYAFSKAHASSHALLAYRSAWLRVHHPAAFACALLDHYGGGYPKRSIASAIGRWGVRILPPCVDRSERLCRVEDPDRVRLGLARLRRISERFRHAILTERERGGRYVDLADFVQRLSPAPRELEAIVLAGAADGLAPLSGHGYPHAHEAALAQLAAGEPIDVASSPERDAADGRYAALVRIRNELRYLGLHPSGHPLEVLRPEADAAGCMRLADAAAAREGASATQVRVAALLAATHRLGTPPGARRFLTLEDETGLLEAILPHDPMERDAWTGGPYLVEGRFDDRPDGLLVVTRIAPFHHRDGGPGAGLGGGWRERAT